LDPNSAENSHAEPPPAVNRGETIEYQLLVLNFIEQDPSSNTSAKNNAQGLTIRVPPKYLYSVCFTNREYKMVTCCWLCPQGRDQAFV